MSVQSPAALAEDVLKRAASMPQRVSPSFGERWAAWQARGAAHDRAVRRKLAIAVPILLIVAAVLYVLAVR